MPKKNKKSTNRNTANTVASISTASVKVSEGILSEEDRELLEIAKIAVKELEPDMEEFRKILEDTLTDEFEIKRKNMDAELEADKHKRQIEIETEIKEKNKELVAENEALEKNIEEMSHRTNEMEQKLEEIAAKQEQIIANAHEKAEKLVADAKQEAEKQSKALLDDIEKRQSNLADREETIEDKEMDLDARECILVSKEKRVQKQAEIFEQANPDAIAVLERKLEMRAEQLSSVQEEYENVQRELNEIKISQIRIEGISLEELQKTNDRLSERVEELENKCNRYTDYELTEMKRALDQESNYLVQIKNLNNEVSERKAELVRVNNSIQEYEQLKSQMDLIRTLNEHLRSELDNTKRMLESSVGEICPALTSIDIDETADSGSSFNRYEERQNRKNDGELKSLCDIVNHVKLYACSKEKPLFYSDRDLRAFIAGMASSPLAILQGMSGTGKTSLPKIFTEALMGEISVVPVESSWRDRNELLGYYNDFSKKFTAKEFTCDLYKAGCTRYDNTPYFIVLDEMNLSRVEYYFADFLSVLEDKKDKWLIKLIDTDMRQLPTEITAEVIRALQKDNTNQAQEILNIVEKLYPDNKLEESDNMAVTGNEKLRLITYLSNKRFKNSAGTRNLVGGPQNLINGNTIRIPKNVWFIGTANRDESTFEITDKVYDRAQVLNFNDRAKGTRINSDVKPVFVTYDELQKLFIKAVNDKENSFRAEDYPVLQEIEQVLKKYFRISYGNRIQDQMNIFVPVYVAAGKSTKMTENQITKLTNEAIDYQLTNKVLRKLEYEDINKDAAEKLRKIFERNGLEKAKDFIDWKTRGEEV